MKKNHQIHLNKRFHDLNPVVAGEAQLTPGQKTGCTPEDNTFIVLHYLVCGSGVLFHPEGESRVHAGQMFIFFPDEVGSFLPDRDGPCSYRWIGFMGSLSPAFSSLPRVFTPPREMFPYLEDKWDTEDNLEFRLASDLFFLYAELVQGKKQKQDYIQMARDYVNSNYMNPITMRSVADHVGLNPRYLTRLFKKATGITMQSHILSVRLWESKRYLQLGYSTKETAHLCGFNDLSNFSKLFKRVNGVSPAAWKKSKDKLNAPMIRFAKNSNITWSVSDPELATITSDGTLTALKSGTVTVIATTDDGFTTKYNVTISAPIPPATSAVAKKKATT